MLFRYWLRGQWSAKGENMSFLSRVRPLEYQVWFGPGYWYRIWNHMSEHKGCAYFARKALYYKRKIAWSPRKTLKILAFNWPHFLFEHACRERVHNKLPYAELFDHAWCTPPAQPAPHCACTVLRNLTRRLLRVLCGGFVFLGHLSAWLGAAG